MHLFTGLIMYVTIVSLLYATNEVWSTTNIQRYDASFTAGGTTGRDPMDIN